MIEKHMSKTQLKLINTAGPLFAEDGLKGTRIRSITEEAGVNVAGINYHFGSKEQLYQAVIKFVFERMGYVHISTYWNELPTEERTEEGIYRMICKCIVDCFTKLFKSNHPIWYFKIIQKELSSPTENVDISKKYEAYQEDSKATAEIFSILKPSAKEWEIQAWLVLLYSQTISLSILMPNKILSNRKDGQLDEKYIDAVIKNTITATTSTLGLKIKSNYNQ